MCRTTDHHGSYQPAGRHRLKIKAFYLHLSSSPSIPTSPHYPLPESLTLLFLPQLNQSPLLIHGSKIRHGLPGFITLHRIINDASVMFGSRETVRVSEGTGFEVYVGEEKLLKGTFRRGYEHHHDREEEEEEEEWKLECNCVLEKDVFGAQVTEAEIFVAAEGCGHLRGKVPVVKRRRRRCSRAACLEGIPEEREREEEIDRDDEECSTSCCCDGGGGGGGGAVVSGSEAWDDIYEYRTDTEMERMERGMEGVRWAVDAGFWVVCLGVGYLVSRASAKRLRRIGNYY